MSQFFDNLDGTSGTTLASRPGWTRPIGTDNWTLDPTGSGYRAPHGTTTSSSTWHMPINQPEGLDQYVQGLLGYAGSGVAFPLGVRCNTSINVGGGYFVRRNTSTLLQLYVRSNTGSFTLLGSYTAVAADLDTYPVRLQAVGSEISVIHNGSTIIGPVTNTVRSSGKVAGLTRAGSTSGAKTIDDWESGDLGTPVIPALISTLYDDFNDTVTDPKWTILTSGTTSTLGENGSALALKPTYNTVGTWGYRSLDAFNAYNQSIFAKVSMESLPISGQQYTLRMRNASNDVWSILIGDSPNHTLSFTKFIGGIFRELESVPYNATDHSWLRLRHDSASNTMKVDTAPVTASDPPTENEWVNLFSSAADAAFDLNTVKVDLSNQTVTAVATASSTVYFEGFNTGTGPAVITPIYRGAQDMTTRYLGTRTESELYIGAKDLFA